jgi:hypothetical protein
MKLYELKKGDKFRVIRENPTIYIGQEFEPEEVFIFDHVDGMYSYCFWEDTNEVVHIAVFQEVEKVLDKLTEV